MELYKNLGGDSNVISYRIGSGEIIVQFNGGAVYEYTNASAGSTNISQMQNLARQGFGLNSYIKRYVNKGYSRRLK